jgi:hypothetical protein
LKKAYRDSKSTLSFKGWATSRALMPLSSGAIAGAPDEASLAARDTLAARAWLQRRGAKVLTHPDGSVAIIPRAASGAR